MLSKTPTRLPQGLEVLSHNVIASRSISSPGIMFLAFPGGMNLGILFSTFAGGMNLLLLVQYLVTHLPSMMEVP